jgi:hypothetical protein
MKKLTAALAVTGFVALAAIVLATWIHGPHTPAEASGPQPSAPPVASKTAPAQPPQAAPGAAVAQPPPVRKVVLVGWDGADRRRIKQYMEAGDLPVLRGLSERGALVAIDILRTTDTKAGWSQILTGYEPEKTGVYNNWRYRPIPKGYTVFERLEDHFGRDRFVTVAVIGKHNNLGDEPPRRIPSNGKKKPKKPWEQNQEIAIIEVDGKKYESIPGKPYYYTTRSLDVWENGLKKDERVGSRAIELLREHAQDDFFFFVHFAEIDTKGHHQGEGSARQREAYVSADTWTGRILDALEELGIAEQTIVYVTSDHGFDWRQRQHKDAPYVFLATDDPAVRRRGERADIAPTILERFGLDLDSLDPPLDGHPLTADHVPPAW